MIDKKKEGFLQVPSELIEDKLPSILTDLLGMYGNGTITYEELKGSMTGIWLFLVKSEATHALVAWNNITSKIKQLEKEHKLLTVIKKADL